MSEIAGRKAPTRELPSALMKMAIPIGPLVGQGRWASRRTCGELIRTSDGVTYWAKDDKARRELGYAPRDMDTGLRETLAARELGGSNAQARSVRPRRRHHRRFVRASARRPP